MTGPELEHATGPLSRPCPHCGAKPGEPCKMPGGGPMQATHYSRGDGEESYEPVPEPVTEPRYVPPAAWVERGELTCGQRMDLTHVGRCSNCGEERDARYHCLCDRPLSPMEALAASTAVAEARALVARADERWAQTAPGAPEFPGPVTRHLRAVLAEIDKAARRPEEAK